MAADNVVHLNVGGSLYATNRSVLTKDTGSRLHAMFSGNESDLVDTNGHVFIDRDGKLFRYILNFLQDDQLVVPLKFAEYDLLLEEVEYYRLKQLKEAIREKQTSIVDIMEFVMISIPAIEFYQIKATKTTVFALYNRFGKELNCNPHEKTLTDVIKFMHRDHNFIADLKKFLFELKFKSDSQGLNFHRYR